MPADIFFLISKPPFRCVALWTFMHVCDNVCRYVCMYVHVYVYMIKI